MPATITPTNIKNWIRQGNQYLYAGKAKAESKSIFNNTIRYNLLSMAFESYAMGILEYYGTMPDNHTYTDLLEALVKVIPIEQQLIDRILKYESIQSICSVTEFAIRSPYNDEIEDLYLAVEEISTMAQQLG